MTPAALRRPLALLAIVCSLAASVTVLVASPAAAFGTGSAGRVNAYEAALLYYMNTARRSYGLAPLVAIPGGNDVARAWSANMAASAHLYHNPNLVRQLVASGSSKWTAIAENVGYASACDTKQLFNAYMASAGHRANILSRSMRYVGIGTYERPMSGWACGQAWNTLDFVNAYTSTYGASRNPPQGMHMDSTTVTVTRQLASFDTGVDPRVCTGLAGTGMYVSRPVFDSPLSTRDDAVRWTVGQNSSSSAGWGSIYLRDALDLRHVRQVRVTLQATTPTGRGVKVSLLVYQEWSAYATIGTVTADGTKRTFTFTVPSTVRRFDNNFRLSVANSSLTPLSGTLSQRKAHLTAYGIDLIV